MTDDGSVTLRSERYGETFRSRHGASSESWHVFVAGSGVAQRLAAGRATTVLEVGLGTARNLAATATVALAFGTELHYVALELDPLPVQALATLEPDALGPPAFRAGLLGLWATLEPGATRRLTVGPVTLEVQIGDARDARWPDAVDAVYHDAFSPTTNPELWDPSLLRRLAGRLAPGAALVSYGVSGAARRALADAGLEVERRPGPPGGKREVLRARRATAPTRASGALAGLRVGVVGAGVVGRSVAYAGALAGASVDVFDDAPDDTEASRASSLPAALVNPYRGRAARASDADLHGARRTWAWASALADAGLDPGAHPTGVVRAADGPRQARTWWSRPGVLPFGPDADPGPGRWRAVDGGIVVPMGGWIDPPRWLAALRRGALGAGARWWPSTRVTGTHADADGVRLATAGAAAPEHAAAFDVVALCIGASAPGALPHLGVTPLHGAVALVPGHVPGRPLAGASYAAPLGSPAAVGLDRRRAYVAVGGGHGAAALDPSALRASLVRALGGDAAAGVGEVAAVWHGVRARGAGPRPEVAEVARGVWWVGAFAGRGFLCAAAEAEALVARWAQGSTASAGGTAAATEARDAKP